MTRSLGIAASALLLLALPALAGDAVETAMKHFEAGEYAKAAEAAEKVPPEDALFARARYLAGESRLALGEAEAAEAHFRAALEKKPDSIPVQTGVGRALLAAGKADEALPILEKAAKADGKDAVARRSLGECLAAKGRAAEARKELEQAQKIDPRDPLAARALAELLLKQGEAEAAGRAAEVHAKADPKSAMGPFLRGLALDRLGKGKDAIEAYEAALARDPRFLDAHKNLAILCITDNPVYSNRERTEKAFAHFEKYFELGGKDEQLKQTYETIRSVLKGDGGAK
jgi:tetratricopeptide (TPR) repeat protein